MFIKACGMTREEQIEWAVELGYTAVGIVLHPRSPRYCASERARELARFAGKRIVRVAVSLEFAEVEPVRDDFDFIQIYEYRPVKNLILAGDRYNNEECDYFLYDTSRGDGSRKTYPAWLEDIGPRLILSGGLRPGNVGDVIKTYGCFGVDASSGLEGERGVKDYSLMKDFIGEVRDACR